MTDTLDLSRIKCGKCHQVNCIEADGPRWSCSVCGSGGRFIRRRCLTCDALFTATSTKTACPECKP